MTDEPNPTPTTEPPMANTPEARTETGELKEPLSTSNSEGSSKPIGQDVKTDSKGVPETYSDFTIPEGKSLDPEILKAATPLFKELGLSQEAAQKLVDFQFKHSGDVESKLTESYNRMRSEWRDAVKADSEIGNKLDTVRVEIGRMKDHFSPELRNAFDEAMNLTGMGDHPAIVKGLYRIAEMINEGTHVTGAKPSPHGQTANGKDARPTLAGSLYPHLPQ